MVELNVHLVGFHLKKVLPLGKHFNVWDSHGLSKYHFTAGSFSEDARGRWYFNIVVELPIVPLEESQVGSIGIDLGLTSAITTSNGLSIPAPQFYRKLQGKLGISQRARNKKRTKSIHVKIKNSRKDWANKVSLRLVKDNAAICG